MAVAKIAVVNDDTVFLDLMHDLLEGEGYGVLVWKEGRSAFEKIRQEIPDLVILDIRLESPEVGHHILEMLTLDPATARIPVIICSADAQALRANALTYEKHGIRTLAKPFDLQDLLDEVRRSLAG
jgi:CheY-like chemotaxis protein